MTSLVDEILAKAEKALGNTSSVQSSTASNVLNAAVEKLGIKKSNLETKLIIGHIGDKPQNIPLPSENVIEEPQPVASGLVDIPISDNYYPELDTGSIFDSDDFSEYASAFEVDENALFDGLEEDEIADQNIIVSAADAQDTEKPAQAIESIQVEDKSKAADFLSSLDDFMEREAISQDFIVASTLPGGQNAVATVSDQYNSVETILEFAEEQVVKYSTSSAPVENEIADVILNNSAEGLPNQENGSSDIVDGNPIEEPAQDSALLANDISTEIDHTEIIRNKILDLQLNASSVDSSLFAKALVENTVYLSDNVELDKYPKEYAKQSTTTTKRVQWFIDQIAKSQLDEASTPEIVNLLESSLAKGVDFHYLYQLGCLALFKNADGATDDQRKKTKDELAEIDRLEKAAAHQVLVEKARARIKSQTEMAQINQTLAEAREAITSVINKPSFTVESILGQEQKVTFVDVGNEAVSTENMARAEVLNTFLSKEQLDSHFGVLNGMEMKIRGCGKEIDPEVIDRIALQEGQILIWAKSPQQVDMVHSAIQQFGTKLETEAKLQESEKQVSNLKAELHELSQLVGEIREGLKTIALQNSRTEVLIAPTELSKPVVTTTSPQANDNKFENEIEKGMRKLNITTGVSQPSQVQSQNPEHVAAHKPEVKPESIVRSDDLSITKQVGSGVTVIEGLERKLIATLEQKVIETITKVCRANRNNDAVTLYVQSQNGLQNSKIKEAVLRVKHFSEVYHIRIDENGSTRKMEMSGITKLNAFIDSGTWIVATSPTLEKIKVDAALSNRNVAVTSDQAKNTVDEASAPVQHANSMSPV